MKANPTWTNTKKKSDYKGVVTQWQPVGPFAASNRDGQLAIRQL
jgi:hypothetical protein